MLKIANISYETEVYNNQHYNEPVSRLLSAPRQVFVGPILKKSEKMSNPWFEPEILTYKHQHLYH